MKLQIDTENKTIKLEKDVVLKTLVEGLEKMFPNGEWKEFTLETQTIINHWSNPVKIKEVPYYQPYPWYTTPPVTWQTNSQQSYNLNSEEMK